MADGAHHLVLPKTTFRVYMTKLTWACAWEYSQAEQEHENSLVGHGRVNPLPIRFLIVRNIVVICFKHYEFTDDPQFTILMYQIYKFSQFRSSSSSSINNYTYRQNI